MPRLFVAIPVPLDVARGAAALIPLGLPALRPVAPELLHVTLAFLGSTPEERIDDVVAAATEGCADGSPLRIELDGLGRIPPTGRPRLVFVGTGSAAPAIERLGGAIREALARWHIPFDPKPLRPHVTLARVRNDVSGDDARRISRAIEGVRAAGLGFDAGGVAVMESVLSSRGPRYSPRATVPLVKRRA